MGKDTRSKKQRDTGRPRTWWTKQVRIDLDKTDKDWREVLNVEIWKGKQGCKLSAEDC
jgi:hypothetical protein